MESKFEAARKFRSAQNLKSQNPQLFGKLEKSLISEIEAVEKSEIQKHVLQSQTENFQNIQLIIAKFFQNYDSQQNFQNQFQNGFTQIYTQSSRNGKYADDLYHNFTEAQFRQILETHDSQIRNQRKKQELHDLRVSKQKREVATQH